MQAMQEVDVEQSESKTNDDRTNDDRNQHAADTESEREIANGCKIMNGNEKLDEYGERKKKLENPQTYHGQFEC